MLNKLGNRFVLWGMLLTCLVGGVISTVGYLHMTRAVRHEAKARVQEAANVGRRLLNEEFSRLVPDSTLPDSAWMMTVMPGESLSDAQLNAIVAKATGEKVDAFAVLDDGLCMVSAQNAGDDAGIVVSVWPLRNQNWLPDHVRSVIFGSADPELHFATITIFEHDIRIATNVMQTDGRRATGTRVSEAVAKRVLEDGQSWNDRAFVVDHWVIGSYLPIRNIDDEVIGIFYTGLDEASYIADARKSIVESVAFILGLTLIIAAGGWYLGRWITRPLTRLTDATAMLSRGNCEHIQASSTDPEEVRVLAESFNIMVDQICAKTESLETSNRQVKQALDDYMDVLGFVAHELKSPVASALTQFAVIDGGYLGEVPESLRSPLAAIRKHLDYAHEISLSFNHLSRVESAGFVAYEKHLSNFCDEVVSPAISDIMSQASQRNMIITLNGAPVPLHADPDLMRVVMDNLIGNAVKYGKSGTEVTVNVHRTEQGLQVTVHNFGTGVPDERFPELFQKFHRMHDPALESRKGTGVGLYMVKKIIDLHRGHVGVEGQYGQWIAFRFEIPVDHARRHEV